VLVGLVGRGPAVGNTLRGRVLRVGGLLASSVAGGQAERHAGVARALGFERSQDLEHALGQAVGPADAREANPVIEDLAPLGDQELAQELHEGFDLEARTLPVLLAERVERERA